jgi:pimeloyl-ACP methyl ester carboxylesterase
MGVHRRGTVAARWLHAGRIGSALAWLLPMVALAAPPIRLTLDDTGRGRQIPVEIHEPDASACSEVCRVVLFGTGYRATPSEYAFLLRALAEAGFFVVGIQHDLEHDPPMPNTGDLQRDRTPAWIRGAGNVEFVARVLKLRFPAHDWRRVVLAGHSQGGDIAARLAATPHVPAGALVTLDNRRVRLPTSDRLPVLTIRSSDQPADPGVLPDAITQRPPHQGQAGICIVRLSATRHDDMNDAAKPSEQAKMIDAVVRFLRHGACSA